jgi:hypothetical protein
MTARAAGPFDHPLSRAADFSGPRFQSTSLTRAHRFQLKSPATAGPALALGLRTAPSWGAVTGLSYPTISAACAPEYQPIQISPLGLTRLSPSCSVAHLCGTRSTVAGRPRAGLYTRSPSRQGTPCRHGTRVRVAHPHLHPSNSDWVERGIAAASARCNRASPIRGTRLQQVAVADWWSTADPGGEPGAPEGAWESAVSMTSFVGYP